MDDVAKAAEDLATTLQGIPNQLEASFADGINALLVLLHTLEPSPGQNLSSFPEPHRRSSASHHP
jgi:hypothetical protein